MRMKDKTRMGKCGWENVDDKRIFYCMSSATLWFGGTTTQDKLDHTLLNQRIFCGPYNAISISAVCSVTYNQSCHWHLKYAAGRLKINLFSRFVWEVQQIERYDVGYLNGITVVAAYKYSRSNPTCGVMTNLLDAISDRKPCRMNWASWWALWKTRVAKKNQQTKTNTNACNSLYLIKDGVQYRMPSPKVNILYLLRLYSSF